MNKKFSLYIIILAVLFTGCSQTKKENTLVETDSIKDNIKIDTVIKQNEADSLNPNKNKSSRIVKLKKLVFSEFNKDNNFNKKPYNSLIISDPNSISKIGYIAEMFPLEKIDSIEFYGASDNQKVNSNHLRMNSLLILYFNDLQASEEEIDSLETNYKKNFNATESMFKPGGISFEIDNQLAIYSVNTCGPGYKNLLRIDTLISRTVFNYSNFVRLHSSCGMGPFKRIEK